MFTRVSFALFVAAALFAVALEASPRAPLQTLPQPAAVAEARSPAGAHVSVDYDLARTGITWHQGLESVLNKDKPVLLFQLLGDFAQVHC